MTVYIKPAIIDFGSRALTVPSTAPFEVENEGNIRVSITGVVSDGPKFIPTFSAVELEAAMPVGETLYFANSGSAVQNPDGSYQTTDTGHGAIGVVTSAGLPIDLPQPALTISTDALVTIGDAFAVSGDADFSSIKIEAQSETSGGWKTLEDFFTPTAGSYSVNVTLTDTDGFEAGQTVAIRVLSSTGKTASTNTETSVGALSIIAPAEVYLDTEFNIYGDADYDTLDIYARVLPSGTWVQVATGVIPTAGSYSTDIELKETDGFSASDNIELRVTHVASGAEAFATLEIAEIGVSGTYEIVGENIGSSTNPVYAVGKYENKVYVGAGMQRIEVYDYDTGISSTPYPTWNWDAHRNDFEVNEYGVHYTGNNYGQYNGIRRLVRMIEGMDPQILSSTNLTSSINCIERLGTEWLFYGGAFGLRRFNMVDLDDRARNAPGFFINCLCPLQWSLIYGGMSVWDADTDALRVYNGDTNSWSSIDSKLTSILASRNIMAIVHDGDENLYVGGRFTSINGISGTGGIARYHIPTNTWHSVGGGVSNTSDPEVNSMVFDDYGRLFVGGRFNFAGGVDHTYNLAMFSDGNWYPVGRGCGSGTQFVAKLLFCNESKHLYIGGSFTAANQEDGTTLSVRRFVRFVRT